MNKGQIAELRKLMSAARAKAKRRRKSALLHSGEAYSAECQARAYAARIEALGGKVRQ